jgi:hypothetical protein
MAKIKHIQGNSFELGIPLAKRIVQFNGGSRSQTDENLSPLLKDAPIRVIFGRCRACKAKLIGGYVVVKDKGTLPVGNYHITVLATDANGDPLRYIDELELGIVNSVAESNYEELAEYDGYFKYPIPKLGAEDVCLIVITDDAVQINEGTGFYGEITDDAVKLYARFGQSSMEVTENAVKITVN